MKPQPVAQRMWDAIKSAFSLDLRSLALLRIGTGILILADLLLRSRDLVAFYTDHGMLPSHDVGEALPKWFWSIHLLNGSWEFQSLLFIIAAAFAVCLIFGYHTRIATIASWILLVSLQNRMPFIGAADDVILRMILFWGMFLPWNAVYSLDRILGNFKHNINYRIITIATIAYLFQVAFIYWFAFLLKSGTEWKWDGTAVYFALSLSQLSLPLGTFLLKFPAVMKFLTYATLSMEGGAPFLFFYPRKNGFFRTLAVFLLMGMHIGFLLTMRLGLFPLISLVCLSGILPGFFWDTLFSVLRKLKPRKVTVYYDAYCGFCKKVAESIQMAFLLPKSAQLAPAQNMKARYQEMITHNSWIVSDDTKTHHFRFDGFVSICRNSPVLFFLVPIFSIPFFHAIGDRCYEWVASHRPIACKIGPHVELPEKNVTHLPFVLAILAYFFLIYIFIYNVSELPGSLISMPQNMQWISGITRVDQYWGMFAPFPLKDDGWTVIEGDLANGTKVDLFEHGKPLTFAKPPQGEADVFPNSRWRKLFESFYIYRYSVGLKDFISYECSAWNRTHSGENTVRSVTLYYMVERNMANYVKLKPESARVTQGECTQK